MSTNHIQDFIKKDLFQGMVLIFVAFVVL